MGVRRTVGVPASNKPPPPSPEPSTKEFPIKLTLSDGEQAWVSIPQVDMISIVGDVLHKHFSSGAQTVPSADLGQIVTKGLSAGADGMKVRTVKHSSPAGTDNHLYWGALWEHLGSGVAIDFRLAKSKSENASHTLRLEFNPRRLGEDGVIDLLEAIHASSQQQFHVGKFLASARVTRLDIAVDIVNARVPELIISANGEAKRAHYYGADGVLETVYIHRKSKAKQPAIPKPYGRALGLPIVRLYDRLRALSSQGIASEFGPTPITRAEVVKTRFGNKGFLVWDLPKLTNVFKGIKVGEAATARHGAPRLWLEYVTLRWGGGHEWASELLGLTAAQQDLYAKAYSGHPSDVIVSSEIWKYWPGAIAAGACEVLVQSAQMYSPSSYVSGHLHKTG